MASGVLWFDDLEPEFEVGALDQLELLGEERTDAYQARRSPGALAGGRTGTRSVRKMAGSEPESVPKIRILGGVEVIGPAGLTRFSGAKQRALFARLAVDVGRPVSTELLIDDVWGDPAPASVRSSLQVHVSQIRRALSEIGLNGILVSRPAGYALDADPDEVDVIRFEHGVAQVRALMTDRRFDEALTLATGTIAMWREDLFADVGAAPFASTHRVRLEAVRVELLCASADAALSAGRQNEVLSWVELAAHDHPYDEQLWRALARLLYGLDRQADAIDRLATLRRTLLDDLGLDPAPTTVELETSILIQDVRLSHRHPEPARTSAMALTRTQLPPLGALIGRDELLESLGGVLAGQQSAFLVTLVGPAGVGKTSVATRAASGHASAFVDGMTFVDLSTLPIGGEVWPAVAAAVGLKPSSPDQGRQELIDLMRGRKQLVVLDGCEHVVGGVADLLEDLGDRMTILATSRSPLGVPLEQVQVVEPLSPDAMTEVFLRRARAADSRFEPSDDDFRAMRRIIAALDGLPLGAELTAPLVRSMSLHEMADSLERCGDAPTRRRPLRDAIVFSLGLLDDAPRKLLVQLSVFAGGTDMAGIRSVCDEETLPDSTSLDANVHALVDASLLIVERTPHGMWYRMLHPIRMAAAEHLTDGERDELRQRHARFLIGEVRRLSAIVESNDPRPGVDGLDRHAANIRQAWLTLTAGTDGDACVELLAAFSPLALAACQRLPDASVWLDELVSAPEIRDGRFGLEITLNAAMILALEHDDYIDLTTQACEKAAERGDARRAIVANALLTEALSGGDNVVASTRGLLTLDLARQLGDHVMFGLAVAFAVNPMLRTRDFGTVRKVLNEALTSDTSSYGLVEPLVLYQAGRLEMAEGNVSQAQQHFQRAGRAATRTAVGYGLPYALYGMARVARREGRVHDALSLMRQVADMDRIMAPTQVAPHCLWIASLAFEIEDEQTVASCLTELGRPATPLELAVEQTIRGFLAILRAITAAAQQHFDRALDVYATSLNTDLFIETAGWWRRTVSDDKVHRVDDVLADVANRNCQLAVALQRLRSIAGTEPA